MIFFDIATKSQKIGKIIIEVFEDQVPRTSKNFIELVTGKKEAFKQLVEALPKVIDDVLEEIQQNGIENTVFEELEKIDENILKSLYLLSFLGNLVRYINMPAKILIPFFS